MATTNPLTRYPFIFIKVLHLDIVLLPGISLYFLLLSLLNILYSLDIQLFLWYKIYRISHNSLTPTPIKYYGMSFTNLCATTFSIELHDYPMTLLGNHVPFTTILYKYLTYTFILNILPFELSIPSIQLYYTFKISTSFNIERSPKYNFLPQTI